MDDALIRFRVPLHAWIPQEKREVKKAFLPFLRTIFYDRIPQYIEKIRDEETNDRRISITRYHQKLHYFVRVEELPESLITTHVPDIIGKQTVILEVIFCGVKPPAMSQTETPYAELIFHYEPVDIPERQFNPMDRVVTRQDELKLARPEEHDPIGNDLTRIANDINPDPGIADMNKFFSNRFEWLREALISCERAIEIMLEGIKVSLGIQEGKDPPEYWEAMGHTLSTCAEPKCLKFRSDWHTIIHMDKYLPWEDLYESYKDTFHRWSIKK